MAGSSLNYKRSIGLARGLRRALLRSTSGRTAHQGRIGITTTDVPLKVIASPDVTIVGNKGDIVAKHASGVFEEAYLCEDPDEAGGGASADWPVVIP